LTTLPKRTGKAAGRRTHVSGTEPLDGFYSPKFRVDSRYAKAFQPTVLIDARGRLDEEIADDIAAGRKALLPRRYAATAG
jgi:hypothetical protein